ncbi:MAG: hypothetical protein LBP75_01015 [Planctomycetota bacterium]|nr:hypothetical protein [Planctomycetota bacterium]
MGKRTAIKTTFPAASKKKSKQKTRQQISVSLNHLPETRFLISIFSGFFLRRESAGEIRGEFWRAAAVEDGGEAVRREAAEHNSPAQRAG